MDVPHVYVEALLLCLPIHGAGEDKPFKVQILIESGCTYITTMITGTNDKLVLP
jgi:hypothetical protein